MMTTYGYPRNSWECFTPDMTFLNCESCALEFANDNNIDLTTGLHPYGENPLGFGISKCWACSHEFDYLPTCDGCGAYLRGYLLPDALEALKTEDYPQWLKDYYLSDN